MLGAFGRVAAFVLASLLAIALVVARARKDAADPMRCAGLIAMGSRCCAPGQELQVDRCVGRPSACPSPLEATEHGCAAVPRRVTITGALVHPGGGDWEADGRTDKRERAVAAFAVDAFEISERDYAECVGAGACSALGLSLSGEPGRAVGGLTRGEAEAYCRFRGGRLPSPDEWTLAAAGTRSRRYPWGDTGAVCRRGAWGMRDGPCGFGFRGPEVTGGHPDGMTPEGVHDLAGNVSEWVSGGGDASSGSDAGDNGGQLARDPSRGGDANGGDEGGGEVRGGSFAVPLATDLRTWKVQRRPAGARSPEVGGRCAYDVDAATEPHLPVLASPVP